MDLSVQHGARLMLFHALRDHMERVILRSVACRSDNAPRSDVQAEYQLSRILLSVCHRLFPQLFDDLLFCALKIAVIVDDDLAVF